MLKEQPKKEYSKKEQDQDQDDKHAILPEIRPVRNETEKMSDLDRYFEEAKTLNEYTPSWIPPRIRSDLFRMKSIDPQDEDEPIVEEEVIGKGLAILSHLDYQSLDITLERNNGSLQIHRVGRIVSIVPHGRFVLSTKDSHIVTDSISNTILFLNN